MFEALSKMEGPFLLWVQETLRGGAADSVVSFYTKLGNAGMLWIALCILCLVFPKTRRAGIAGALALLMSLLLTNGIIKHLAARTRPWLVVEGLIPLVAEHDPNSFPSGHTSAAFAAACAWQHTLPERWMRVTVWIMAVCMGLSRLYVGVHFPTDVLCGTLVGILCGQLGWCLLRICENRLGWKRQKHGR